MMNIQDKSAMPNLAGIFYPDLFQVNKLVEHISPLFPESTQFQSMRYKNLELGGWNAPIVSNERKTLYAMLDGKILNAKELKGELIQLGFHFKGDDDAEVLLHAYSAWQEDCIKRLNGPFTLAILDTKKEQLLLSRDRIGQKTLYWSDQGDYWLFSTQMKGLLATGLVAQNPSLTAFATFLHFGFVPQELSLIHDVHKLLPGNTLTVNLKKEYQITQYFSLSQAYDNTHSMSKEHAIEELGETMKQATDQVLIPDEKLGVITSSNLGSTSLNWFLSHQGMREKIDSYDAAFDSITLNESKQIADELNLNHQSEQIDLNEAISHLPEIIWNLDEPVSDPYLLRTWALAKLGKNSSYAIAEHGWKELFAAHSRYFSHSELGARPPFAHTLANLPKQLRDHLLLPSLRLFHLPYRFNILRNVDINRELVNFLLSSGLFQENARKNASPALKNYFNIEVFSQRFHRLTNLSDMQISSIYFDLKTSLPNLHLHQYDQLFSCNQTQVLSPFLDNGVIDLLTAVPNEYLFQGNLLEQLLHKLNPNLSTTSHPRSYVMWSHSKQLRQLFSSLEKGRLVEEGLISKKWIQKQASYPTLTDLAFKQLWSVLTLEIWFRLFINRPIGKQRADVSVGELLESSVKVPEIIL